MLFYVIYYSRFANYCLVCQERKFWFNSLYQILCGHYMISKHLTWSGGKCLQVNLKRQFWWKIFQIGLWQLVFKLLAFICTNQFQFFCLPADQKCNLERKRYSPTEWNLNANLFSQSIFSFLFFSFVFEFSLSAKSFSAQIIQVYLNIEKGINIYSNKVFKVKG